jgi:uncharacterized protein YbaR (Trm112 family)
MYERTLEVVVCPHDKQQKLALQVSMRPGTRIVCPRCKRTLRVVQRQPARLEVVPPEELRTAESSPESYG